MPRTLGMRSSWQAAGGERTKHGNGSGHLQGASRPAGPPGSWQAVHGTVASGRAAADRLQASYHMPKPRPGQEASSWLPAARAQCSRRVRAACWVARVVRVFVSIPTRSATRSALAALVGTSPDAWSGRDQLALPYFLEPGACSVRLWGPGWGWIPRSFSALDVTCMQERRDDLCGPRLALVALFNCSISLQAAVCPLADATTTILGLVRFFLDVTDRYPVVSCLSSFRMCMFAMLT